MSRAFSGVSMFGVYMGFCGSVMAESEEFQTQLKAHLDTLVDFFSEVIGIIIIINYCYWRKPSPLQFAFISNIYWINHYHHNYGTNYDAVPPLYFNGTYCDSGYSVVLLVTDTFILACDEDSNV